MIRRLITWLRSRRRHVTVTRRLDWARGRAASPEVFAAGRALWRGGWVREASPDIFEVESGENVYRVRVEGGSTPACTCDSYKYRPHLLCKHAVAVGHYLMAAELVRHE